MTPKVSPDKKFEKTEPVVATLRQAIAEAEKQEPWVKTYCGGKPNYTTPEQEPVAIVSGYTNGECVVTPINPAVVFSVGTAFSYTAPVHASDISQERVDETAKSEHEFECPRCGHCCQQREWVEQPDLARVGEVGVWGDKREWVGLTDEERLEVASRKWWHWEDAFDIGGFARAIEQALKEKNT
jgi:hypothetical protein